MPPGAIQFAMLGLAVALLGVAQRLGGWESKPIALLLGAISAALVGSWAFLFLPHPFPYLILGVLVLASIAFLIRWEKARKKRARSASSPRPLLVNMGPGNVPGFFPQLGEPFAGRELVMFIHGVSNEQHAAMRVARNVRARLVYEHADDRFTVEPAAWAVFDDVVLLGFSTQIDLEPGVWQRLVLAVRERHEGGYRCFAATVRDRALDPTQPLRFGAWTVTGTITTDYGNTLRLVATFNIDRDGNLVALHSAGT